MKARLSIAFIIAIGLALTLIALGLPAEIDHSVNANALTHESDFTGYHVPVQTIVQDSDTVTWVRLYPITSPPPLDDHAMAYDSARGRVVLFGGYGPNRYANDTWVWDGVNWAQQYPSAKPGVRSGHAMAYDSMRERIVLFGGGVGNAAPNLSSETWEWNGTNWVQQFPAISPSARQDHAMAYDSARGRVVLFGGWNGTTTLGDTWEWDGTNWMQRFPALSPSARNDHAMAYDSKRARVVLFGGSLLTDTWEWDGTSWMQRFPVTTPSARSAHAMVYDSVRGRVVLFGEWNGYSSLNDTWEWDGDNWIQRSVTISPAIRFRNAMAYDSKRGRVVLFGGKGSDGSGLSDTWEYYEFVRLAAVPTYRTVFPGLTTFFSVAIDGLQLPLTLTLSTPPGVLGRVSPSSIVTPPMSVTLVLTTSADMIDGVYPITITGQGNLITATAQVTLTVLSFNITPTISPSSRMVYRGQGTSYAVNVTATPEFTLDIMLEAGQLPGGTWYSFVPATVLPGHAAMLYVTTTASTPLGLHQIAITSTVASLARTTYVALEVKAAVYLPIIFEAYP